MNFGINLDTVLNGFDDSYISPAAIENATIKIRKLIDGYGRFGFLYNKSGMIDYQYRCPYQEIEEDGEYGPLRDSEGKNMTEDAFDEFECRLNVHMDIHNYRSVSDLDKDKLPNMTPGQIADTYLKSCMEQLTNMCRRGLNYAFVEGIGYEIDDDTLCKLIAKIWLECALITIKEFQDKDTRIIVTPARFTSDYFASDEYKELQRTYRLKRKEKEQELLTVIRNSFTDGEWNALPVNRFKRALNAQLNIQDDGNG